MAQSDGRRGRSVNVIDWPPGSTGAVVVDVIAERQRQEQLFPGQRLPSFVARLDELMPPAEVARGECQFRAAHAECSWYDVLVEEVAEACDAAVIASTAYIERNRERAAVELRAELIQVAAVAVRWIEAIDNGDVIPAERPEVLA